MPTPKQIGIMGGSFNPVHAGHLMVASYVAQWGGLDEVWLVLSPQNPLKRELTMASDADRLAMLRLAVGDTPGLRVSDVELTMPRPSYTIDTLRRLAEQHPDCRFRLIVGADNWQSFARWRNCRELIDDYGLTVYPRPGYRALGAEAAPGVSLVAAPQVELSSTFLRQALAAGRDVRHFLPQGVYRYILAHGLYGAGGNSR